MQYLIMHGSYGSPDENWFRWLERELITLGNQVILKQFPVDDWDQVTNIGIDKISSFKPVQALGVWEEFFVSKILPKLQQESTNFIGHSLAPLFILHMLQKYDFQLAKAIFVSPFFNIPDRSEIWQFYPTNKTFYSYDFDFAKINSQLSKSDVVYGDDDPYVPATEPPMFAQKLGSEVHVVKNGGHCGSIFKEFPLILDIALSK